MPVENLLGEIGKGHKIAFNILNVGRLKLAAFSIGGGKAALGKGASYAMERKQFGKSISKFGLIVRSSPAAPRRSMRSSR